MEEYISRREMMDTVKKEDDKTVTYHTLYARLLALSPADVRPNIKGHWISHLSLYGEGKHDYQCSECGRSIHVDALEDVKIDYPFCHCGANMQ